MKLKPGSKAPAFEGTDQDGNLIRLKDLKGQKIILYFYPKDNTPACTAQACSLRDGMLALNQAGYQVIGVSADSEKSHQKFAAKQALNFSLLSDPDHLIINAYGVWGEKMLYGRKYMGIIRTTFVINEQGKISHIIEKVDTKEHSSQLLREMTA